MLAKQNSTLYIYIMKQQRSCFTENKENEKFNGNPKKTNCKISS